MWNKGTGGTKEWRIRRQADAGDEGDGRTLKETTPKTEWMAECWTSERREGEHGNGPNGEPANAGDGDGRALNGRTPERGQRNGPNTRRANAATENMGADRTPDERTPERRQKR